jgi:hypothetical protein
MENWSLLNTKRDYVWVHLEGVPSAHAVLETDDPAPDEFEFARQRILEQTKKAPKHVGIIHAPVGRVKRGTVPGEVVLLT